VLRSPENKYDEGGVEVMLVFEYHQRVRLKEMIPYENASEKIACYIDSALGKEEKFLEFHQSREYKEYVFDLLNPCEKDGKYRNGQVYTFRIRTISQELAEFFSRQLPYHGTNEFVGVGGELKIVQQKVIDTVYSLTPVILKNDGGYWREKLALEMFEQRLSVNLIKKYNYFFDTKLEEPVQLYEFMEFKNTKPVKMAYTHKGITLLGDKLQFVAAKNQMAQDLWYMALGCGLGENNSRGAGFLNFRYL
jgi:CRISPR-associated endoribonuclease Cas6